MDEAPRTLSHREVLAAFSGLLVALLLAALDGTIVATALPTIVGELGGLERLSWVVTAYLLAQTVVTPLYGKLGDIYGRKLVLQVAILIFLAGSALCGLAVSLPQLVAFRAVQGLGGGGLMVTAQAVVADLVPPRERGRWQGLFGAVFGLASIAGPLVGGFFTTHLSWRWIFYINLPLGIVALLVLRATLPGRTRTVAHRIDYAGAALLAVALAAIVLATDLGGVAYPWTSWPVLTLAGVAAAGIVAFVLVERRASEPLLPLHLFASRTFTVGCAVGFAVGFALFGSVTYVPLFLQVVKGETPTASGLQLLPLMGGMLAMSIASGQLISRTGRYKAFPVVGTALLVAGLGLLARLGPDTSVRATLVMLLLVGMGLGLVMQVLVIAVQNTVDHREVGIATSAATLFRLVGGSLGTAAMGAVFASRLGSGLSQAVADPASLARLTPTAVAALDPSLRAAYRSAFTESLGVVFALASFVAALAFAVTWLLPEHPLRRTNEAAREGKLGAEVGDTFVMPHGDDSAPELLPARSMSGRAARGEEEAS
jgi:EmrB/QacA subfamily drug resistance transporter